MAKCEQGYLCDVCGEAVADLSDSDLYLRYIIGMVPPESLHVAPERHVRCNPALAQFIVDDSFPAAGLDAGEFDKRRLDPDFVRERETLVTRGWRRLVELSRLEQDLSLLDYPLPEFQARADR